MHNFLAGDDDANFRFRGGAKVRSFREVEALSSFLLVSDFLILICQIYCVQHSRPGVGIVLGERS